MRTTQATILNTVAVEMKHESARILAGVGTSKSVSNLAIKALAFKLSQWASEIQVEIAVDKK